MDYRFLEKKIEEEESKIDSLNKVLDELKKIDLELDDMLSEMDNFFSHRKTGVRYLMYSHASGTTKMEISAKNNLKEEEERIFRCYTRSLVSSKYPDYIDPSKVDWRLYSGSDLSAIVDINGDSVMIFRDETMKREKELVLFELDRIGVKRQISEHAFGYTENYKKPKEKDINE